MKIGYARVSTDDQHLDLQLSALKNFGCTQIFSDHGFSGVRFDRPGLLDALKAASRGATFVVWRLDRLGRSLAELIALVAQLGRRGVEFVSLTENIDTTSPAGRLTFHMIAALAEFERSLISERTKAGLVSARNRGSILGRPPALLDSDLDRALVLLETYSQEEVAKTLKVHVRTLRRHLSKRDSH